MKKIYLFLVAVVALSITGCTNEDTFNNPVHHELESGSFIRFENNEPSLTFSDPQNISFSDVLVDANANTVDYLLKVKATVSGVEIEADYFTTTSFPATLDITSAKLAEVLNLEVTDFNFGDDFKFTAYATRNDGVVFNGIAPTYDDEALTIGEGKTEPNLLEKPAYRDAMKFQIIISCGFVQEEIVGTYSVVSDEWGDFPTGADIEVTAGATPDTYRIALTTNSFIDAASRLGFYEATVNIQTGATTVESTDLVQYNSWYEMDRIYATEGLTLSCVGYISVTLNFHRTIGGTYVGYTLVLQKN